MWSDNRTKLSYLFPLPRRGFFSPVLLRQRSLRFRAALSRLTSPILVIILAHEAECPRGQSSRLDLRLASPNSVDGVSAWDICLAVNVSLVWFYWASPGGKVAGEASRLFFPHFIMCIPLILFSVKSRVTSIASLEEVVSTWHGPEGQTRS